MWSRQTLNYFLSVSVSECWDYGSRSPCLAMYFYILPLLLVFGEKVLKLMLILLPLSPESWIIDVSHFASVYFSSFCDYHYF